MKLFLFVCLLVYSFVCCCQCNKTQTTHHHHHHRHQCLQFRVLNFSKWILKKRRTSSISVYFLQYLTYSLVRVSTLNISIVQYQTRQVGTLYVYPRCLLLIIRCTYQFKCVSSALYIHIYLLYGVPYLRRYTHNNIKYSLALCIIIIILVLNLSIRHNLLQSPLPCIYIIPIYLI